MLIKLFNSLLIRRLYSLRSRLGLRKEWSIAGMFEMDITADYTDSHEEATWAFTWGKKDEAS